MKPTTSLRTILYISLDAFFTSVEQALNPSLRGQPIIVCSNPLSRNVVAGVSYEARVFGVRSGMTISTAQQLARQAQFVEGSFSQYEKFSEEFYRILSRFSDIIEPVSLDEAYLELKKFETQWINAEAVAEEIRKTIQRELEIPVSIGIASNKVTARAAAKTFKPRQVTYVPWGQENLFLKPLPITSLPTIGPRTADVLREYGVQTIGDLAMQSDSFLDEIFGPHSRWLWTLAHGIDLRPVLAPGRTKSITRSRTFSFATQDSSIHAKIIYELLDAACSTIRTTRQIGRVLQITGITHWGKHISRQRRLEVPTNSTHQLSTCAELLLDQIHRECSILTGVQVRIDELERRDASSPAFTVSFRRLHKIRASLELLERQFGFRPTASLSRQIG
ncbi:MAG: DNA polymerase IV [Candidatus Kerfeldbacteria bacterium]|nr:DNA polymerase IV [Candidatus Kerfeldbacteria bacterium]